MKANHLYFGSWNRQLRNCEEVNWKYNDLKINHGLVEWKNSCLKFENGLNWQWKEKFDGFLVFFEGGWHWGWIVLVKIMLFHDAQTFHVWKLLTLFRTVLKSEWKLFWKIDVEFLEWTYFCLEVICIER